MKRLDTERVHLIKDGIRRRGPVVYWMSRDQRALDNWALLFARERADELKEGLSVVFSLAPGFLGATLRQYSFMLKGLMEAEGCFRKKGIPFHLLLGEPDDVVPVFIKEHGVSLLVTDFDPLKIKRAWKERVSKRIEIPFYEVDAHNIVPCRAASEKKEFGAYTIRPKIKRLLPDFLTDFPPLLKQQYKWKKRFKRVDWKKASRSLKVDNKVTEADWMKPGGKAALKTLRAFINDKLTGYDEKRNDPNLAWTSGLSPYLHFGHISAQRVALEVKKGRAPKKDKEAFLEELIVRRELSDNFCFYNKDYDNPEGFPAWARDTISKHKKEKREYLYTVSELEKAATHDPLWNAAQRQMAETGKMHGYLRMYWCKKILEWTKDAGEAMRAAIYLNDKYELDGRDPNGYTGIAWSIGGVHDRAWFERPVFGKIRYMNYNGCKSKFDVDSFIERYGEKKRGAR